jgi:hypothetical protein
VPACVRFLQGAGHGPTLIVIYPMPPGGAVPDDVRAVELIALTRDGNFDPTRPTKIVGVCDRMHQRRTGPRT